MDIGQIRSVNINEEMRGSYLDYAMSVIERSLTLALISQIEVSIYPNR